MTDWARVANKQKTHCKRGHRLAGKNLAYRPDGSRRCRTCQAWRAGRWVRQALGISPRAATLPPAPGGA